MMKAFWFSFVLVFDVLALFYVFGQQPAKLNNLTQSEKVIKTDIAQESTSSERIAQESISSERNNDLNESDFVEVKYRPQAATARLKRASYKMPYKMAYKTAYKTKS